MTEDNRSIKITTVRPDEIPTQQLGNFSTGVMSPVEALPFKRRPGFNGVYLDDDQITTLDAQFAFFKDCVKPGEIKIVALTKFLKVIPFQATTPEFPFYKMWMRQNVYSQKDISDLAKVLGQVCASLRHDVNPVFGKRVYKSQKETAFLASNAIANYWQFLTNAIAEPAKLGLRAMEVNSGKETKD